MNQKEQVNQFVEAIKQNARQVWDDEKFIDELLDVQEKGGSIVICDNFERFFSTIYRVDKDCKWCIRTMYSYYPEKEYSFEKALCDASMMYTG